MAYTGLSRVQTFERAINQQQLLDELEKIVEPIKWQAIFDACREFEQKLFDKCASKAKYIACMKECVAHAKRSVRDARVTSEAVGPIHIPINLLCPEEQYVAQCEAAHAVVAAVQYAAESWFGMPQPCEIYQPSRKNADIHLACSVYKDEARAFREANVLVIEGQNTTAENGSYEHARWPTETNEMDSPLQQSYDSSTLHGLRRQMMLGRCSAMY